MKRDNSHDEYCDSDNHCNGTPISFRYLFHRQSEMFLSFLRINRPADAERFLNLVLIILECYLARTYNTFASEPFTFLFSIQKISVFAATSSLSFLKP